MKALWDPPHPRGVHHCHCGGTPQPTRSLAPHKAPQTIMAFSLPCCAPTLTYVNRMVTTQWQLHMPIAPPSNLQHEQSKRLPEVDEDLS
jgi:hypothetical protein